MAGALMMVLVMLLVGPILVFAGGAAWSALLGWTFASHSSDEGDAGGPSEAS